jgi:hypothetical protein
VKLALLFWIAVLLAGCHSSWQPTALTDGYQLMVMNSEEAYVANAEDELIFGPKIKAIGIAPGVIVVDCGPDEVVINGFANTVGFNLVDTKTGKVTKRLTLSEAQEALKSRGAALPEMREPSSYLP